MADPAARQIRAARAVVWRPGAGGTQVALVHRSRYDDWTFPKGKREPGEHVLATAVREVAEETGLQVILGRALGAACYENHGVPKRVDYWAGNCQGPAAAFAPNSEVDELDWLESPAAGERLTHRHDTRLRGPESGAPTAMTGTGATSAPAARRGQCRACCCGMPSLAARPTGRVMPWPGRWT